MDAVISAPVAANGDFAADVAAFSAYWRTVREATGQAAAIEAAQAGRARGAIPVPAHAMPARSTTG